MAEHWPAGAELVETAVFKALDVVVTFPRIGVATDEAGVHRWPMRDFRYTIFYRIAADDNIDVLCIIDASRLRDLKRVPRG
jgi:plasmid stabilization system protein ParE